MGIFRPAVLSRDEAQEITDAKISWILSACVPSEVWLFGSAASNRMTKASDVDIALVFKTPESLKDSRKKLYATPRPDNWPQDIVFFVADDFRRRSTIGGLPMLIVQDGVRIHPEKPA